MNLFFLFSFDEIIIPPPSVFVNTFLYISFNFLLFYITIYYAFILYIFYIIYYFLIILSSYDFILSSPYQPFSSLPMLINRQGIFHTEPTNTHEYCVMWYRLSFCHQARCLSVSEFERLADHKRMYHIADAMVFAGLCGWRPVVFIYIYPLL